MAGPPYGRAPGPGARERGAIGAPGRARGGPARSKLDAMRLADLIEHGAFFLDEAGRAPVWHDDAGGLPPVFDLRRCPSWAGAEPGEVFARHHFASVPFDARAGGDPAPNGALRRVCEVLDGGAFPSSGGSVLLWNRAGLGWASMVGDVRWPDGPGPREALAGVLDAVGAAIGRAVGAAAAVAGSAYEGARLAGVVTYNLQRRAAGGGQYKPHFDYESGPLLRAHVERCAPALWGRPITVLTVWIATGGLASSPLVFYPRGALRSLAAGEIGLVELGDLAVTDGGATADAGRALLFAPDLCMHGAAGLPDEAGVVRGRRSSLEVRSFALWEEGFSPKNLGSRA
jgi:hypothetical protein